MNIVADTYFKDAASNNLKILKRADTDFPREWAKLFKKNAAKLTPAQSYGLRRSIITQVMKGEAQAGWRAKYAVYVNRGWHEQKNYVSGPNMRDGGFATIKPQVYTYGTGSKGFADQVFRLTQQELPAVLRGLGLTK